jgi:hypothetical protein
MIISPQNSAEHAKLGELIVHIEQSHHVFTRSELERIADILHAMKGAEMPVLAEIERCFAELRADLIPHLMKEERIFFLTSPHWNVTPPIRLPRVLAVLPTLSA